MGCAVAVEAASASSSTKAAAIILERPVDMGARPRGVCKPGGGWRATNDRDKREKRKRKTLVLVKVGF
jgi:hypothetical protein